MAASRPDFLGLRVPAGEDGETILYDDYTFAELDREVDARCRRFTAAGIQRGARVLLLVRPGLDLIAAVFALFKIGAVPVLIDPGMGLRGFLRSVGHARPSAVVAIPQGVLISRVFYRSFASVSIRVTPGSGLRGRAPAGAAPFPAAETRPDELAAILFTSGSTGPAKGVCYEHGMFAAQVEAVRREYGIEPGEIDLPMLPIFALFNPALGMTTVIPQMNPSRPATVDPAKIVRAIRQCGVTNSFGSPVLWKKIGRYCRRQNIRLPSLRRILMAGVAVPPDVLRDYREILDDGAVIHTPYGATESLPVASISGGEILSATAAQTSRGAGTCVGRPVRGIEARIIPTRDEPIARRNPADDLPVGKIGEIIVRGAVVTKAYDGLPEATAAAKIHDEGGLWRRMGDLGYFDDHGRLWFCGRKAERVETRNGTLYTDCCEAIFNAHPLVYRSALIGIGPRGQQIPAIVIEPEEGSFPKGRKAVEKFLAELRALAGEHEHTRDIKTFFFHRSFPVDVRHNAKIHRLTLAKKFGRHHTSAR